MTHLVKIYDKEWVFSARCDNSVLMEDVSKANRNSKFTATDKDSTVFVEKMKD